MIVIDTSAWIEFLRATGSPTHTRVKELLAGDTAVGTTDTTLMEVVAGARDPRHAHQLRRLLGRAIPLPTRPFFDHESAAALFARCRRSGVTPRTMIDCLIATVAIRHKAPLLHNDRDFDRIAEHSDLEIA